MLNNLHLPVQVVVSDCQGEPVEHARVTMESAGGAGGKHHGVEFQPHQRCHMAFDIDPGPYLLRAEASGYVGDERLVRVQQTGLWTALVLGPPGLPFFYRGKVKIPFRPHPDLLAVALASTENGCHVSASLSFVSRWIRQKRPENERSTSLLRCVA